MQDERPYRKQPGCYKNFLQSSSSPFSFLEKTER